VYVGVYMLALTCFLVMALPVAIVATMRERLVLWGIVDGSHFPVDSEGLEWQKKVMQRVFPMCLSS
jgi:hypothetical protein